MLIITATCRNFQICMGICTFLSADIPLDIFHPRHFPQDISPGHFRPWKFPGHFSRTFPTGHFPWTFPTLEIFWTFLQDISHPRHSLHISVGHIPRWTFPLDIPFWHPPGQFLRDASWVSQPVSDWQAVLVLLNQLHLPRLDKWWQINVYLPLSVALF